MILFNIIGWLGLADGYGPNGLRGGYGGILHHDGRRHWVPLRFLVH